jgi:hypothetical protein
VFLHGGISGAYCRNSLASLTQMARTALSQGDASATSVLTDQNGPLWYRGLAGVEPVAAPETVQAILEHLGAHHVVIGHTPTNGAIWPRYSGKVIQIDTGMSAVYGGHVAWLEETKDGLYAGYPSGRIRMPSDDVARVDYLKQVVALQPDNTGLQKQLSALEHATPRSDGDTSRATDAAQGGADADPAHAPAVLPICGISP